MYEQFPHVSENDRLGAGHVNGLSRVARDVSSGVTAGYSMGVGIHTGGLQPYVQRVVEIIGLTCDGDNDGTDDDGLAKIRPRYYSHDDDEWNTNDEDGPYCLDYTAIGLTEEDLEVGDLYVAYYDPQRGQWIPIDKDSTGGDTTIAGGSCNCGNCIKGLTMPSSSTVCCRTHIAWEFVDPWLGGTQRLKWTTGNVWWTDAFSGDSCDEGTNTYRWVMTVDADAFESTLELVIEEDNGCDVVCMKLIISGNGLFKCQCDNIFEIVYYENVNKTFCKACVTPFVSEESTDPYPCGSVSCIGITDIELPNTAIVVVSGFEKWCQTSVGAFLGNKDQYVIATSSQDDAVLGECPVPFLNCPGAPCPWEIDINVGAQLEVAVPGLEGLCVTWFADVVIGTANNIQGCEIVSTSNVESRWTLWLDRGPDCTWILKASICLPAYDTGTFDRIDVCVTYEETSPSFTDDLDGLLNWLSGGHTLTIGNTDPPFCVVGDLAYGPSIQVFLGNATGTPDDDGSCVGCSPPDPVVDEEGACCLDGGCYDMSEEDCNSFGGRWYATDSECESICEEGPDWACCTNDGQGGCDCENMTGSECNDLILLNGAGACGSDAGWHNGQTCSEVGCDDGS